MVYAPLSLNQRILLYTYPAIPTAVLWVHLSSMVIKLVVFLLLGGLCAILQRQSVEAKSPHILFIVADDLGKFFVVIIGA